jgi:RNA polymerase sigma factor (sigma-70 family)
MDEYQAQRGNVVTSDFAKRLYQYFAEPANPPNIEQLSRLLQSYIRRAHIVPETEIEDATVELLQDVIVKALEIQERYPGNNVQSWLLGIAGKLLLQKKQKVCNARETSVSNLPETRRLEVNEAEFFDQFASMAMNDPNQHFALRNQLQACLVTLSLEDQRILHLHIEYGMNLHEVAGKLAITHTAARKRFQRALDRLRTVWNAQENGKGGQSHA